MTMSSYTAADVRRALQRRSRVTPEDFQALLSPAALPFLEEIAQAAQRGDQKALRQQRLICLRRCTLPTTVKTTAFTADLTVTTRFAVRCLTQKQIDMEMAAIASIRTPGNPDPDRREPKQI